MSRDIDTLEVDSTEFKLKATLMTPQCITDVLLRLHRTN